MSAIGGIVAVALGAALLVLWWPDVAAFVKALLAVSLVFWGSVVLIVNHAQNKARRDFQHAKTHDPVLRETEANAEQPQS